ncbi:MAG: SDR family oxidoreductase [SAR202 cluster bacterium]|nr:SDR family oxidoreductase [SAR202 cluster bacterium]
MQIDKSELRGKVAIVTGAGQGMGRACAERLAAAGASIVVNDINLEAAMKVAKALHGSGAQAIAVQGDVVKKADADRMVAEALKKFGGINVLVNNAGVLRPTPVIDIEEEEWDWVIDVNLKGTYICSRAVLPAMRKAKWGRIVNFSSTAGKKHSTVGGAHYTAAKAGILGFTRHLAREEARNGITVNSVCPGLINTEMVTDTVGMKRALEFADTFPINRLGRPDEVAELVAFLASDRAAYITGAALDINGGDLMI